MLAQDLSWTPFPFINSDEPQARGTSLSGRAEVKCSQQGGPERRKEDVTIRMSTVGRNGKYSQWQAAVGGETEFAVVRGEKGGRSRVEEREGRGKVKWSTED